MKTIIIVPAVLAALVLTGGCKKENNAPRSGTARSSPRGAGGARGGATADPGAGTTKLPASHPATAAKGGALAGTVLETMNAGGYSYVKLKTAQGEVWAAVQQATIKVGDSIGIARPALMKGFKSKTLNRTFDAIYFGSLNDRHGAKPGQAGAVVGAGASRGPMGLSPGTAGPNTRVSAAHAGKGRKKLVLEGIAKAEGGYTVAEIFAQRKALAGKKITVRAQVTKFNARIMGKNWLHVQDGSGSEVDRSFDLTVTTNETIKVGDVVVLEGVLAIDKNLGAGYAYPALVEQATLKK